MTDLLDVIDGEEAPDCERPPFAVTRCVKHSASRGCEASLPSCCRELVRVEPPRVGYFDPGATP